MNKKDLIKKITKDFINMVNTVDYLSELSSAFDYYPDITVFELKEEALDFIRCDYPGNMFYLIGAMRWTAGNLYNATENTVFNNQITADDCPRTYRVFSEKLALVSDLFESIADDTYTLLAGE